MAIALLSHTSTQIPQKRRPPQIPYVLRSRHSFSKGRQSYSCQISYHLPIGRCGKLVLQAPARMYLFSTAVKRKVPAQLSGVQSGARHKGRLLIMCSEIEGDTPVPEVPAVESPSPGGIQRSSHYLGYQSPACGASAQSSS
jgi:hypothetical protein